MAKIVSITPAISSIDIKTDPDTVKKAEQVAREMRERFEALLRNASAAAAKTK